MRRQPDRGAFGRGLLGSRQRNASQGGLGRAVQPVELEVGLGEVEAASASGADQPGDRSDEGPQPVLAGGLGQQKGLGHLEVLRAYNAQMTEFGEAKPAAGGRLRERIIALARHEGP